jgi:hypothetical protein
MTNKNKTALILLAAAAIAGMGALGAWWWHSALEQVWEARSAESEAAHHNRMLAATKLLQHGGHKVTVAGSLGELALDKLPDGTLLLADASGVMEQDKAARLLAWVRRGNTLVAQPRWITPAESDLLAEEIGQAEQEEGVQAKDDAVEEDAEDEEPQAALATAEEKAGDSKEELVENDPIAARLGVRLFTILYAPPCDEKHAGKRCKPVAKGKHKEPLRRLQLPGTVHMLELDAGRSKLISMPEAAEPLWSDEDSTTVRVYQEGKGKIVILADDFFNNKELREHDHGELLLALAALNLSATHVAIVQNLDALPWYRLLWKHYSMALLALAALLALLFWAAVRRFGPVLPQPVVERRSLMEHIDASGAWLWKNKGGAQVLLDAAREDTLAVIRRRAPALFRMPETELVAALARMCDLPEDQVTQALYQAAAPTALHFTRQIRILQELRNHHER